MDYQTLRQTDEDVILLPGARVSGDVTMGSGCSVWYNAVIRGDEAPITIGEDTNIQDNCTLHTSYGHPLQVGSGVTVWPQADSTGSATARLHRPRHDRSWMHSTRFCVSIPAASPFAAIIRYSIS